MVCRRVRVDITLWAEVGARYIKGKWKVKTYVIHGAPLSGKTTYVNSHKGTNDLIYDYDLIMSAISGNHMHNHNNSLMYYVLDIKDLIISKAKSEQDIDNLWVITTNVTDDFKRSLVGLNAEYIEMKVSIGTAKDRLYSNPDGRDIKEWEEAINRYFVRTHDNGKFYKTTRWKDKRKAILKRDGYYCQQCKRYGKTVEATNVHHIMPLAERPDLKLNNNNLISLCDSCHELMHDRHHDRLSKLGKEWGKRLKRNNPNL